MPDGRRRDGTGTRQIPRLHPGADRFLAGPHSGVLTTLRPDGSAHLAPVRFTWDDTAGLIRVMTTAARVKTRNVRDNPGARAAICQSVQFRWITFEGPATVSSDPARVAEGVRRYLQRYASPPPNVPRMVVIEVAVDRVMGLW
ncbi:pyridoxamine 5'-phosphate oxidase family protein [Streptomyces sp. NPDC049879]|uniref:pyridoxamine 5'-phosphate oxidase family protein n=1 Tax=Streptomyces sp. NPDC049879 TaxID=3365598 RepID=UPI00379BB764